MSHFKYKKLCDIQINHQYFENGFCPKPSVKPVSDLAIVPTPHTALFFKKKAFRFNIERANSLSIYGEVIKTSDNKEVLKYSLANEQKWVFAVYETGSSYRNLTDMPLDFLKDKTLYLTNLTGDNAATPSELHLMKAKTKIDWQMDAVPIYIKETYSYTTLGMLNDKDAKLTALNSTKVILPSKLGKINDKTQVLFDLKNIESGLYTLTVKGVDIEIFYYLNIPTSTNVPLAVIEIYGSSQLTSNYQWENADKSVKDTPPQYFADFGSRSSVWQYYISFKHLSEIEGVDESTPPVPVHRAKVKDISVTSSIQAEVFALQPGTSDREFLFFSQQPLLWAEKKERILTLKCKIDDRQADKQGLPYPTSVQKEANTLISKIFIKL